MKAVIHINFTGRMVGSLGVGHRIDTVRTIDLETYVPVGHQLDYQDYVKCRQSLYENVDSGTACVAYEAIRDIICTVQSYPVS